MTNTLTSIVIDPPHNCELSTPTEEPNIYNMVNELQNLTKDCATQTLQEISQCSNCDRSSIDMSDIATKVELLYDLNQNIYNLLNNLAPSDTTISLGHKTCKPGVTTSDSNVISGYDDLTTELE